MTPRSRWTRNRALFAAVLLGFLPLSLEAPKAFVVPTPWSEVESGPAVCKKASGVQQGASERRGRRPTRRSVRLDPRSPYARHGVASCHAVALDAPPGIVVAGRLEYCAEFTKPDSLQIRLPGTPQNYRSPPA